MIKIVTDSVASIPADMLADTQIQVVSLYLNRDGVEYVDNETDIDDFYADIYTMANNIPTSSQPSQTDFINIFEKIAQDGDELLGIFLSTSLSGTYEGAVQAARTVKSRDTDFKYAMVDSSGCAFDQAWPVFAANKAIEEGATLDEAVAATLRSIESSRFIFTIESLVFLQKGGRIGNATALLGNLIKLTPVLTVKQGKADIFAKTRSRKKALDKIIATFKADIDQYGLKNVVVHYIGDKTPAIDWAKDVIEPLLGKVVRVIPVSPVVGLHVGPAIGISYECNHVMKHKFPQGMPSLVTTQ